MSRLISLHREEILKDLETMTYKQVAQKYDVCEKTVYNINKNYGSEKTKSNQYSKPYSKNIRGGTFNAQQKEQYSNHVTKPNNEMGQVTKQYDDKHNNHRRENIKINTQPTQKIQPSQNTQKIQSRPSKKPNIQDISRIAQYTDMNNILADIDKKL